MVNHRNNVLMVMDRNWLIEVVAFSQDNTVEKLNSEIWCLKKTNHTLQMLFSAYCNAVNTTYADCSVLYQLSSIIFCLCICQKTFV